MQLGVVALDPKDQLALVRLAGHDRQAVALELGKRPFLRVEPQAGFTRLVVGTVAGEAVIGEDRPDIAREIDRARFGIGRRRATGSPQRGPMAPTPRIKNTNPIRRQDAMPSPLRRLGSAEPYRRDSSVGPLYSRTRVNV